MYRNSDSIVRTAVGDTTPFPITVGVHQGSVLSPYLFSVILDELSANVQKLPQPWLLMYADDNALVDRAKGRITRRGHAWREALENGGLKLNVAKTEYMACNSTDLTSLRIGDDTVERTDNFRLILNLCVVCAKPYQTLVDSAKPYQTLVVCAKPYQTLVVCAKPYQTLVVCAKPYQTLVVCAKPYQTLV
ncbi:unnamed protein product [Parnassius apollo]|uniref:(apollo) hypothetical protein n=1 Tax=Parnassius apollo TaxID=110799 RepID=A0A8S3XXP4_PARAO|nr:unnamed protein product [Parnassius apollo]